MYAEYKELEARFRLPITRQETLGTTFPERIHLHTTPAF